MEKGCSTKALSFGRAFLSGWEFVLITALFWAWWRCVSLQSVVFLVVSKVLNVLVIREI